LGRRRALALEGAFILVSLAAVYAASGIGVRGFAQLLASRYFAAFCTLMIAAELLKSARLKLVIREMHGRTQVTMLSSFLSRLVSNLAGALTPSSVGSIPAQALTLSSRHSHPVELYIGSGLVISMVDAVTAAAVNLTVSFALGKYSITAIAASAFVAVLWVSGIYVAFFRDSTLDRLMNRLYERYGRLSRWAPFIDKRLAEFRESVRLAVANPKVSATSAALGACALILTGYAMAIIATPGQLPAAGLSLLVGSYAYALSFFPTPGGSGFYEIGLSEVLGLAGSARTRASLLLFYAASGLISLLIVTRDRRKFLESLRESILMSKDGFLPT